MENFGWWIVQYGWTAFGLLLAIVFGILGVLFALLKEKACVLISGYNSKTKQERAEYDEVRLSRDERNFFFLCAAIYLAGAVASIWVVVVTFWIAFFLWLVYFIKDVHFDDEKAFGKYKK